MKEAMWNTDIEHFFDSLADEYEVEREFMESRPNYEGSCMVYTLAKGNLKIETTLNNKWNENSGYIAVFEDGDLKEVHQSSYKVVIED